VGGFNAREVVVDLEGKTFTLLLGDGRAGVPQLVGARAEVAVGAGVGVGFGASGRGVVPGPVAWVAVAGGVCFSPDFQRADGCLDGTIVPWHTGRRVQDFHAEVFRKLADCCGNEGRSVIAFQDERRAVADEQVGQGGDDGVGGDVGDGKPEQDMAAGEVADGEQVRMKSVDERSWAVEVDGPDGAGPLPMEDVERLLIAFAPDAAIAVQDVVEFGASHAGELESQAGQADARAQFVDAANDDVALFARGAEDRPAERQDAQRVAREVEPPVAQGARRQPEQVGRFGPAPAFLEEAFAQVDSVTASRLLLFPFDALAGEAAPRRAFGDWFARDSVLQMVHDDLFGCGGRPRRERLTGVFFSGAAPT